MSVKKDWYMNTGDKAYDNMLNELYFGKNKELADIEVNFQKIIDNYKSKKMNPNGTPEMREIERLVCDLFGFSEASIHWSFEGISNAYTYPASLVLTTAMNTHKIVNQNNKTVRFNKADKIIFISCFDIGLIEVTDLTAGELTAVLLHEIGHNFNHNSTITGMYETFKGFNNLVMTLFMPNYLLLTTRFGRKINSAITKFFENNKFLRGLSKLSDRVSGIFKQLGIRLEFMADGNVDLVSITLNTIFGYHNEKFADNFASAYGYASETASVESKFKLHPMTAVGKVAGKVPIVNWMYNYIETVLSVSASILSTHPSSTTRIKDQISYLESELNKQDLNPRIKAMIKSDLDNSKKEYDKYLSDLGTLENLINEPKLFTKIVTRLENQIFGGDIKELIFKTKNYDYDQLVKNAQLVDESVVYQPDDMTTALKGLL